MQSQNEFPSVQLDMLLYFPQGSRLIALVVYEWISLERGCACSALQQWSEQLDGAVQSGWNLHPPYWSSVVPTSFAHTA